MDDLALEQRSKKFNSKEKEIKRKKKPDARLINLKKESMSLQTSMGHQHQRTTIPSRCLARVLRSYTRARRITASLERGIKAVAPDGGLANNH